MQLWAFMFAFVSTHGDAAFLHYRQMETWSSKTSGSTCYPSYPPGAKNEGEGARRRKDRKRQERRGKRDAFHVKETAVNVERKRELLGVRSHL